MRSAAESQDHTTRAPLVVHVIHQLGVGGLENGLVNLINHMPVDRYRHAIVCLKGYSDFHKRINTPGVEIVALGKHEGHDLGLYVRLFRTLRRLRPDIVHTRNLAALEGQVIAVLARVGARAHGEHGRDMFDLDGTNRKYRLLRKFLMPFVGHFIAVSKDLENWLVQSIGVRRHNVSQIYNGVDQMRFHPRTTRPQIGPAGFISDDSIVIGSTGRMVAVKDYPALVKAFLILLEQDPVLRHHLRLLIVGEGEARSACLDLLQNANAKTLAWLPGERSDIPELMRAMDVFVLPSLGEGISNTILEAMASGLPVVASRVGGNVELIQDGVTGALFPPGRPDLLAAILGEYVKQPRLRTGHGRNARARIESHFSMEAMTDGYLDVYDRLLQR